MGITKIHSLELPRPNVYIDGIQTRGLIPRWLADIPAAISTVRTIAIPMLRRPFLRHN